MHRDEFHQSAKLLRRIGKMRFPQIAPSCEKIDTLIDGEVVVLMRTGE
jgi:hypothetical protein